MGGHMFDDLAKGIAILAIAALLVGAVIGAIIAWLVLA